MYIKHTFLIFILKYTQNIDHIVQIFSLNYNGNRKRACRQLYVQEYSLHFPRAMPSVLPAIEIEISSNDRRSVLFFFFSCSRTDKYFSRSVSSHCEIVVAWENLFHNDRCGGRVDATLFKFKVISSIVRTKCIERDVRTTREKKGKKNNRCIHRLTNKRKGYATDSVINPRLSIIDKRVELEERERERQGGKSWKGWKNVGGFCAWRERKRGRGMQAQKGEEGKEKHDVGVGKARSLSRDAGRVSSRRTVMFGERAKNRVSGSVGNRSRFFTATLFLLSTFATSVWTDNTTGSIGE